MKLASKYEEIMKHPHHVSKTRPQMPMSDRAAQFASFAALTGYDSAIKETGRLTDEKIELDEEALTALDMKYQILMDAFDTVPEIITAIDNLIERDFVIYLKRSNDFLKLKQRRRMAEHSVLM